MGRRIVTAGACMPKSPAKPTPAPIAQPAVQPTVVKTGRQPGKSTKLPGWPADEYVEIDAKFIEDVKKSMSLPEAVAAAKKAQSAKHDLATYGWPGTIKSTGYDVGGAGKSTSVVYAAWAAAATKPNANANYYPMLQALWQQKLTSTKQVLEQTMLQGMFSEEVPMHPNPPKNVFDSFKHYLNPSEGWQMPAGIVTSACTH